MSLRGRDGDDDSCTAARKNHASFVSSVLQQTTLDRETPPTFTKTVYFHFPLIILIKDKATDPQNNRPVSVLPTLASTFEKALMPQLSVFLLPHIPEEQFGFIAGTGTLDVSTVLADQIAQALQA